MTVLPTITLYQPWATWIIRGWKTIETRTHDRFRCLNGKTILIHAGLNTDAGALFNPYLSRGQVRYKPEEMINGYILGSARVIDYKVLNDLEHSKKALISCAVKRYGLFLTDIQPFAEPIKASGSMGIWYFDLETNQKVPAPKVNAGPQLF